MSTIIGCGVSSVSTVHVGTLPVRGRRQIGIGALLTLFVLRAMYMLADPGRIRP